MLAILPSREAADALIPWHCAPKLKTNQLHLKDHILPKVQA